MLTVLGFGLLGGRKVIITADDYTIRAGHADGAISNKTVCTPAHMHEP